MLPPGADEDPGPSPPGQLEVLSGLEKPSLEAEQADAIWQAFLDGQALDALVAGLWGGPPPPGGIPHRRVVQNWRCNAQLLSSSPGWLPTGGPPIAGRPVRQRW